MARGEGSEGTLHVVLEDGAREDPMAEALRAVEAARALVGSWEALGLTGASEAARDAFSVEIDGAGRAYAVATAHGVSVTISGVGDAEMISRVSALLAPGLTRR